jgi:hypothetical protein
VRCWGWWVVWLKLAPGHKRRIDGFASREEERASARQAGIDEFDAASLTGRWGLYPSRLQAPTTARLVRACQGTTSAK